MENGRTVATETTFDFFFLPLRPLPWMAEILCRCSSFAVIGTRQADAIELYASFDTALRGSVSCCVIRHNVDFSHWRCTHHVRTRRKLEVFLFVKRKRLHNRAMKNVFNLYSLRSDAPAVIEKKLSLAC